jgi:WD40 repeat protein
MTRWTWRLTILVALCVTTDQGDGGETDPVRLASPDPVYAAAYSPDGTYLATGGQDRTITLWDVRMPAKKKTWSNHSDWITSLSFSSNGKWLLAVLVNGTLVLIDVPTFKVIWRVRADKRGCVTAEFSPDSKTIASGGSNGRIKFWDTATGRKRVQRFDHGAALYAVAYHPGSDLLASRGNDGMVKIWKLGRAEKPTILRGHLGAVRCLAFSPDGSTLVSGGDDRNVHVWDLSTGKERQRFRAHREMIRTVAFTPDGKLLATAGGYYRALDKGDTTVKLWQTKGWKPYTTLKQRVDRSSSRCGNGVTFPRMARWRSPGQGSSLPGLAARPSSPSRK